MNSVLLTIFCSIHMHILIANITAKQFVSYDDKHVTGDVKVSCKRYIFMNIFFSIRSSLPILIQNMHTVIQDVALFDADEELIQSGADEIASKTDKKKSSKSKESKSKDSKKSKKSSKSKSSRSSRSSRSSSSSSSSSGSGSGSFDSQDCRW